MTNDQKIRLRLSQVRGRLNDIAGIEDLTDEIRSEAEALHTELNDLSIRERALIPSEGITETRDTGLDAEARERLELRSRASLTAYILAALSGRQVDGPEAELRDAAGIGGGVPVELWDQPTEIRQDAPTVAPGTVGVNLDRIMPSVFSASIAPQIGVEMPRVESGTYASATISTPLTAAAQVAGADAHATAATFAVTSATVKRVSARLGIRIEDVASVGQSNFEPILRENLALVLSDALDNQMINGDGTAPNLTGIFARLTDPTDPTTVTDFDALRLGPRGRDRRPLGEHAEGCFDHMRAGNDELIRTDFPDGHELQGRDVRCRLRFDADRGAHDQHPHAGPGVEHPAGDPLPEG